MIPEKFIREARAEYRGNVYLFIGLGEGRKMSRYDLLYIKRTYTGVEEWFEHLTIIGQLRVVTYLREVDEKVTRDWGI